MSSHRTRAGGRSSDSRQRLKFKTGSPLGGPPQEPCYHFCMDEFRSMIKLDMREATDRAQVKEYHEAVFDILAQLEPARV